MKKVLVVGAGYAGVLTAKSLARKVRKAKLSKEIEITIVDKNPFSTMLTELHEVAAGRVEDESIRMSLKRIFDRRNVKVVMDRIEKIDFEHKQAQGQSATYDYDYLVIAAGSRPTDFGIKGVKEYAHKLWSYDDAVALRQHFDRVFREALRETDAEKRRELLSFYIVGSGFTGVEMAGELAEYRDEQCRTLEMDPSEVCIEVVDFAPRPVPILPEKQSKKVWKHFEKLGIGTKMSHGVVEVGPNSVTLKAGEEVTTYPTQTVIWAAGIESSELTASCAQKLSSPERSRGRLLVNEYLQSVDDSSVYVVGDNMFFIPEGEERPVPQMVENCEQSAALCAKNLFAVLTGKGERKPYRPAFHGVMVSVGSRKGVAVVGTAKKQISLASWFALFCKHFINIIYFLQVLGWNKVASYCKHEFFRTKNKRSLFGGHLSMQSPTVLLVALRIWLGCVWLYEGVMKIVEGWLVESKLEAFFSGANQLYARALEGVTQVKDAATAAVDASSGATEAANAVATKLFDVDLWLLRLQLVSSKELAHSSLNDIAFRMQSPLQDWLLQHTVLASSGLALATQISLVCLEILIGLSLITGTFTSFFTLLALFLQFMFVTTTGLYLGTVWMVFAAIACLFGSSYSFGVDYYLMPVVKKGWKRLGFVRKSYLYND